MEHELTMINSGYCGGCSVCGNREEMIACTGCDWADYPIEPDQQFADHLHDVAESGPDSEQAFLGHVSDDPWAAAG